MAKFATRDECRDGRSRWICEQHDLCRKYHRTGRNTAPRLLPAISPHFRVYVNRAAGAACTCRWCAAGRCDAQVGKPAATSAKSRRFRRPAGGGWRPARRALVFERYRGCLWCAMMQRAGLGIMIRPNPCMLPIMNAGREKGARRQGAGRQSYRAPPEEDHEISHFYFSNLG